MAARHAVFAQHASKDAIAIQYLCLVGTSTRLLFITCTLTDQTKQCKDMPHIVCLCCSACSMMVDQNIASASSTTYWYMSPTFITFTQVHRVALQSDSIFTETFDSMSALRPDFIHLLRPGADTAVMQHPIQALSTKCSANVLQDLAQSFLSSWPTGIMTITLKLLWLLCMSSQMPWKLLRYVMPLCADSHWYSFRFASNYDLCPQRLPSIMSVNCFHACTVACCSSKISVVSWSPASHVLLSRCHF